MQHTITKTVKRTKRKKLVRKWMLLKSYFLHFARYGSYTLQVKWTDL